MGTGDRAWRALVLAIPVLLMSDCSTEDNSGYRFTANDDEGVLHATTFGGPKYQTPVFTFVEHHRLHQNPSVEGSLLYQPGWWRIDERGYSFVADIGNKRIAVFDETGEFVQRIGRGGSGPGEFMYPYVVWVKKGLLGATGGAGGRAYRFKVDGDLVDVITDRSANPMDVILPAPGDRYVIRKYLIDEPGDFTQRSAVRMTACSSGGDTLGTVETEYYLNFRYIQDAAGNPVGTANAYFYPRPLLEYAPGRGIYATSGDEPVVRKYGLDGALQMVITLPLEKEPITRALRDSVLASTRSRLEKAETPEQRDMYRRMIENAQLPAFRAFWHEISVDDSGFVWLRKAYGAAFSIPTDRRPMYYVVDSNGTYLGVVKVPHYPGYFSGGYYLTYESDPESGEQSAIVYDIVPVPNDLKYPGR